MRSVLDTTGYLLDPHTAVGVVASNAQLDNDPSTPSIVLATAHPAKFPDAVKKATGIHPALPPHLADLLERKEHFTVVANDVTAIESFIAKHSRIGNERPSV
jgi:threonine synthase